MVEDTETMCRECNAGVDEEDVRWTIVGEKDVGFDWLFLCIQCVRDWRQRGLEREGLSDKEIAVQLEKEHPITQSN